MPFVGTPLEGEHPHSYSIKPTGEEYVHDKDKVYTRSKDPDSVGINQDQYGYCKTVPEAQCSPPDIPVL